MWISTGMFRRAAVCPNRIELRIVQLSRLPSALRGAQAEILHHLAEAERAGLDVGLELLRGALAEARADVAEVDVARTSPSGRGAGVAEWRATLLHADGRPRRRWH